MTNSQRARRNTSHALRSYSWDDSSANACDRSIDEVRRKLKLGSSFEFHFREASDRMREQFFTSVSNEQFKYYGFVLNKPKLFGSKFKEKRGFYDFTVGLICENARPLLHEAKIIIDKCGDRTLRNKIGNASGG